MRSNDRGLWVALGVLIVVLLLVPTLGGGLMGFGMMGPGMMWGWGYGRPDGQVGGWPWGLAVGLGLLSMIAFWGAIIVGIVLLVRWLSSMGGEPRSGAQESALDILRRRFAAGELTQEQYDQMRRVLTEESPRGSG